MKEIIFKRLISNYVEHNLTRIARFSALTSSCRCYKWEVCGHSFSFAERSNWLSRRILMIAKSEFVSLGNKSQTFCNYLRKAVKLQYGSRSAPGLPKSISSVSAVLVRHVRKVIALKAAPDGPVPELSPSAAGAPDPLQLCSFQDSETQREIAVSQKQISICLSQQIPPENVLSELFQSLPFVIKGLCFTIKEIILLCVPWFWVPVLSFGY